LKRKEEEEEKEEEGLPVEQVDERIDFE